MSIVERLREGVRGVLRRCGPGAAAVSRIALRTLMPVGGERVAEILEELIGYVEEKGAEVRGGDVDLDAYVARLGEDQAVMVQVVDALGSKLDSILAQMATMQRYGTPDEGLAQMLLEAVSRSPELQLVQSDLASLQVGLAEVKAQGEAILREARFAGDLAQEMAPQVKAVFGVFRGAIAEGVPESEALAFVAEQARFQKAFVHRSWPEAQQALEALRQLAPGSAALLIGEAALLGLQRDYVAAQRSLQGAVQRDPTNALVRAAHASMTTLSRGALTLSGPLVEGPTSAGPPRVEAGSLIGDKGWRLLALLGRGGMGEVWLAENRRGFKGALKLMLPELSGDPEFQARFEREIAALEQVAHPNVVRLDDWGFNEAYQQWYFVTEHIEGESLATRLVRQGALAPSQARTLFLRLAEGLAACHARGVIHRDIKPANVMLRKDGSPVLIDFGVARSSSTAGAQVTVGASVMTLRFAAPEQIRSGRTSPASDVFSLGMCLAESLQPAFEVEAIHEVAGPFGELLEAATAENLRRRITTMEAFAEALLVAPLAPRSIASAPAPVRPPAALPGPGARARRRRSFVAVDNVQVAAGDYVLEMVQIPAGDFVMGCLPGRDDVLALDDYDDDYDEDDDWDYEEEKPPRRVVVAAFEIGAYPVTFAQFDAFCEATRREKPKDEGWGRGDRPIINVNWREVRDYLSWLEDQLGRHYRLPCEAEWEYAARAGTNTAFAWGNDPDTTKANFGGSVGRTTPVGTYPPNPWGIYDMHGNVWEWVQDQWHSSYRGAPSTAVVWGDEGGDPGMLRGGSWDAPALSARSANRSGGSGVLRDREVGFRLARSLP